MNHQNNLGGISAIYAPITDEQAQSAARKINHYMATQWLNTQSSHYGAEVTGLSGFHASHYGEPCLLWNVVTWNKSGLHSMLFLENDSGKISLNSGDYYFLREDLYPAETRQAELVTPKGGEA